MPYISPKHRVDGSRAMVFAVVDNASFEVISMVGLVCRYAMRSVNEPYHTPKRDL